MEQYKPTRKVITSEYTKYAGDYESTLYLDLSIKGFYLLCLDGDHLSVEHLTSDYVYMVWLCKNAQFLLDLKKEEWFSAPYRFGLEGENVDVHSYYDEFHSTLNRLKESQN
jgi:hypothetical protein